jgi:hypothetical protein
MTRFAIVAATLALTLAACAAGIGEPTDGAPTLSPLPTVAPPTDGGSIGQMDQQMIDDLLEQAAQETGVALDEIRIVTAEAVTWSDGSIGCPEEGMGYTQALVPGFRAVIEVAGEEMHYHAGSDGQFVACDDPQEPIEER